MIVFAPPPALAGERLARFCAPPRDGLPFPQTLVALAHPGDETLGASSRLRRLRDATFLFVSDGAPRDGVEAQQAGFGSSALYAAARRAELQAALAHAGIGPERVRFLGIAAQEAASHLSWLVEKLLSALLAAEPEVLLTHAYEGGHPDHDATAFAAHIACRLLAQHDLPTPTLIELACYHGYDGDVTFGTFLPAPTQLERLVMFDSDDFAFKQGLIACHGTQRPRLDRAPTHVERFRLAPTYDFEAPPHPEPLLYETSQTGLTGEQWRAHARAALERLELSPVAR